MPGRLFTFTLVPFVMGIVLWACGNKKQADETLSAQPLPERGIFCFKAERTPTPEYLHLQFEGDQINGSILLTQEVEGEVYYNFSGHVANDSLLKVKTVTYARMPAETGNWSIHFYNDRMELNYQLYGKDFTRNYQRIDCGTMPDTAAYSSVKEVEEDHYAEYIENVPYESYVSVFADSANKALLVHEYLRIWKDEKRVFGKGAGGPDGKAAWTFGFNGLLVNDSTMEVKVDYQLKGKTFSARETWIEDKSRSELKVKEKRREKPGAYLYHKAGPDGIPEYYDKLLWMEHE